MKDTMATENFISFCDQMTIAPAQESIGDSIDGLIAKFQNFTVNYKKKSSTHIPKMAYKDYLQSIKLIDSVIKKDLVSNQDIERLKDASPIHRLTMDSDTIYETESDYVMSDKVRSEIVKEAKKSIQELKKIKIARRHSSKEVKKDLKNTVAVYRMRYEVCSSILSLLNFDPVARQQQRDDARANNQAYMTAYYTNNM